MKRVLFVIVVILLILFVDRANAFTKFKRGEYLEKNQWGALEDIMADWKAGKLTTDECALYGCYVLAAQEPARTDKNDKAKLVPTKYKLNKKSIEAGPYFYIYFLYKNEEKLGQEALEEFRNSDWCDESFINEIVKNDRVDEAIHKLFSLSQQEVCNKVGIERDLLNVLCYLSDIKTINYETVLIITYLYRDDRIRYNQRFSSFKKKHNLDDYPGHFNLIIDLSLKAINTNNRKAINVLNFRYKYLDLLRIHGYFNKSYYKNGFNVSGGLTGEENILYANTINEYYNNICINGGYNKPIGFLNNKTLEVTLSHGTFNGDYGWTTPIETEVSGIYDAAAITLYVDAMNDECKKYNIAWQKTVIHELFHSIQYSYSSNKFYWFIPLNGNYNKNFAESTATWSEDFFYNNDDLYKKYLDTIFKSKNYFFRNPEINRASYEYPGWGLAIREGYYLGFFWNYICNLRGNDSVVNILKLLVDKSPVSAIKSFIGGEKEFCDILHNFGINNFFIAKQKGIYPFEDEFIKAADNWKPLPVLKIIDDNLNDHYTVSQGQIKSFSITLNPLSTQFIRIDPEKRYFENSTFISFKLSGSMLASVITSWTDVGNDDNTLGIPKYFCSNLENLNNGSMFRYYTKKGINPKYFIIAITNGNTDLATANVEITLDKPANLSNTISNAGQNYNNDIFSFFSKGVINNVKNFDSEIATLYAQYKSDTNNQFYGNQLYQKIVDLNLYMQTTLTQIHDLRYQYYLAKSEIVNSIMEGTTSSSIKNQILKYCDFVKKMAKIIDTNPNSIDVFNGWVVMYHVDNKLKTTKAPANWTQEEYAAFDKDANAAMKKISSAFSNSKYEYKYTNEQIKDSVSVPMVGMPAIEIPGPIVNPAPAPIIPGPFMVNFCPNIEKKLAAAVPVSHKFSDLIFKGFDFVANGKPYKSKDLLCISDTFSPLSLKYFSSIAVHAYHEDNMPPQPAVSNVKGYVSSLGFYMKVCKDHISDTSATDQYFNTKDIMIGGSSKQIANIISLLAEAIIREMKDGKKDLYTALNKEISSSIYKDEILDLLEKQLKKDGYRE